MCYSGRCPNELQDGSCGGGYCPSEPLLEFKITTTRTITKSASSIEEAINLVEGELLEDETIQFAGCTGLLV